MLHNYSVCIQGFSSFERATFESFFRLASQRAPSYRCVDDIAQADIVIADADRAASIDAVASAGRLSRTLTIGARSVPGSIAATSRPINMMALLRMLDELTASEALRSPANAGDMSVPGRVVRTGPMYAREPAAPLVATHGTGSPLPASTALAWSKAPGRGAEAAMTSGKGDPGASHILVVDDSDIALRFMQMRLHRLRFQVSLATSGDEALRMLETRRYAYVFLDVMMAGLDGFQTCKRIKGKAYPHGAQPPRVIMLTSKGGPIDKLRGTISGCDGYLVKPLDEVELIKVIKEFDPGFQGRFEGSITA